MFLKFFKKFGKSVQNSIEIYSQFLILSQTLEIQYAKVYFLHVLLLFQYNWQRGAIGVFRVAFLREGLLLRQRR